MAQSDGFGADRDEQSEAERQEIARRYRTRRGEELKQLASSALGHEPIAAGEFSTRPLEALAAIPVLGALLALAMRLRPSRGGLSSTVLVAIDSERVHLLEVANEITGPKAKTRESWQRSAVRVTAIEPAFMRERIILEIEGTESPPTLYASSLRTNPWAAQVVGLLGGDAPEPRDLG